jgi:dTDP-4-amino-4,6-dideoxygalactose transaminase
MIHTTYNIDSNNIERKITNDTVAILAARVYRNPCYVEHLQEIADIERNAQIIRKMV